MQSRKALRSTTGSASWRRRRGWTAKHDRIRTSKLSTKFLISSTPSDGSSLFSFFVCSVVHQAINLYRATRIFWKKIAFFWKHWRFFDISRELWVGPIYRLLGMALWSEHISFDVPVMRLNDASLQRRQETSHPRHYFSCTGNHSSSVMGIIWVPNPSDCTDSWDFTDSNQNKFGRSIKFIFYKLMHS